MSNLNYNNPNPNYNSNYSSNPKGTVSVNNFVGKQHPEPQEDIDLLSEKHDQYIELILEEE